MRSHATVNVGSAHHTRRELLDAGGGGGGGKDTLEGAVMPSMLVVASMTVTEVTTRIGLVGGVATIALLLIGRSGTSRRDAVATSRVIGQSFAHRIAEQKAAPPTNRLLAMVSGRSRNAVTRLFSLGSLAVIGGVALGVGLSLALVVLLNATISAGN
ncbi:MAG: hypothetical protein RLZZ518_281 [Actinomycetota bacterium]